MALQITQTLPNGISVSYHKIFFVSTKLTPSETIANISIASYCCATERTTEKASNQEGALRIQLTDYDVSTQPIFTNTADVYTYLKTLPEFAGAVDC